MNQLALKTAGLHVSFGSGDVLRGVSIEVRRGSIAALLGANGSGKSTFVRTVAGILPANRGSIEVAGYSLSREPESAKRRVGALVDGFALFSDLSLWEQVFLVERVYGLPAPVVELRAAAVFRDLGLWRFRNQRAGETSFGTQKKCALALALIHRPDLIILDEPFEDLDRASLNSLIRILQAFAKAGSGILVVTHLFEVVESLADDFWILAEGAIQSHWNSGDICSGRQPLADKFREMVGDQAEPDVSWIESPRS